MSGRPISIYDTVFDASKSAGYELVIAQDGDQKIGVGKKTVIKLKLAVRKPDANSYRMTEKVNWPEHVNQAAARLRDRMMEKGLLTK